MSAGQRQGQAERGEAETVEQRVEHPDSAAAATNATRVFLTLVSAWFVPHGLQIVLYPWLLAVYLHLPPEQVGLGQMFLQVPGLFLVLWAGSLADRVDTRQLIGRLHLIAAVPPLVLALMLWLGLFQFSVLLAYGLAMGACVAFANPSRDAMLATVAQQNIQRVVVATTGVQFGVQVVGYALAMLAGLVGPAPLLVVQSAIMASGALIARRLPARQQSSGGESRAKRSRGSLFQGFSVVVNSPQILSVMLLSLAGSVLYLGAFFVLVPLLIRDYYGGGATEIGMVNIGFMAGTMLMVWMLLRGGGIRRQGRAYMAANLWGATFALSVIATGVNFAVMMGVVAVWGAAAGIGMSMARTIIQEHTPESHRARVFAVYQLCFMAGGPVGSLMMGYLIGLLGPLEAARLPPIGMVIVLSMVFLFTDLWKLEARQQPAG